MAEGEEGDSEIPVIVETYDSERHESSPNEPVSETVEPAEVQPIVQDEATTTFTVSSGDGMSSESFPENVEPLKPAEAVVEEEQPEVEVPEAIPESESNAEAETEEEAGTREAGIKEEAEAEAKEAAGTAGTKEESQCEEQQSPGKMKRKRRNQVITISLMLTWIMLCKIPTNVDLASNKASPQNAVHHACCI